MPIDRINPKSICRAGAPAREDWIVSLFLVNGQQETERLKERLGVPTELEVRSPTASLSFAAQLAEGP